MSPTRASTAALAITLLLALPASTAAAGLGGSLPFRATLTAPTHHPRANTKWFYTVRVTSLAGKPIAARITVQIRDPLGTLHPVLYANTKKKLVNWPVRGSFRDYVIWPRSSAIGIALTLSVTVKAAGRSTVLRYEVTPRA